jgi:regulatory protein
MDRDKVLAAAADILTYRSRSAAALRDRLEEKGFDEADAAWAVTRLTELGFIDDAQYGADLVAACRAKGWGKGRIRQELRAKKLDAELADSLLEDFEPDYDKMTAFIAARLKGERAPDRAAIKRVSDSLARKGFSWEQIRRALERYTEQTEEMEP